MIFDLDGTLVQTEKLKALSYAKAAMDLCPYDLTESEVIEAFREFVGLSRREVAEGLVKRFDLETKAKARVDEFGVGTPWQAYVQVRLNHYERMLAEPEVILKNQWPHNLALLEEARLANCKTGLATMSRCHQATRVLEILELAKAFDFVATRDDVEHGKPNPEINLLVSDELGISPKECLVIEDSPSGVKAAIAAGMWCIAVTTPFTKAGVHELGALEERWIVDVSDQVARAVRSMVEERMKDLD
jgi:beta-phosphoglucomutase-like phosphatase (HAD superfamily)